MAGWIGIDLGASRIRIAALGEAGGMYRTIPTPAPHALNHFIHAIRDAVLSVSAPLAVGLARAPQVDPAGVINRWPSRPDWAGIPLLEIIRNHTGRMPYHMDDGAAAASWESADSLLAGKTAASLVIGTGLAIGCARNGITLETGDGAATPAHEHAGGWDAPCRCGKSGCFQTVLSGDSLRAIMTMEREHALKAVGGALENVEYLLRQRYGAEHLIISGNILLNPRIKAFLAESISRHRKNNIIFSPMPQIAVVGGALLAAARNQTPREKIAHSEMPLLRKIILDGLLRQIPALPAL